MINGQIKRRPTQVFFESELLIFTYENNFIRKPVILVGLIPLQIIIAIILRRTIVIRI